MNYIIGIDYGTLSARAVLVNSENGEELAEATFEYPHGVMDRYLPSGRALGDNFALQHPSDYLEALSHTVKEVIRRSGISADEVRGIGIDFTACTLLPIDEAGEPLVFSPKFSDRPHAYVKLWKHHAAQPEADEINALAAELGEPWLNIYGGKISSEWALPKILETLRHDREVFDATYRFTEAADWLSLVLTGEETRSAAFAGYKALWNAESGYPSNAFLRALDERLDAIVGTKLSERVLGTDKIAGRLNSRGAALTGLAEGTYVALPMIDAHAAMPALNMTGDGDMMMIVGTSSCHITNSREAIPVTGICGYVKDGVIPGLYTYEAGQSAVGDVFDWFVKSSVPADYHKEAEERGIGIHKLLREKAMRLSAGDSGLIALDWLGGNRSILVNADLTGLILGLNLQTKPEEIYRALIEATAFGTRVILEQYAAAGMKIGNICAAGDIAKKDEMMMQIYADILGREIYVAGSTQAAALGSAIYAAVAAGIYPTITEAASVMAKPHEKVYTPNMESHKIYSELYSEYKRLHDLFGNEVDTMLRLKSIKNRAKSK